MLKNISACPYAQTAAPTPIHSHRGQLLEGSHFQELVHLPQHHFFATQRRAACYPLFQQALGLHRFFEGLRRARGRDL